VPRQLHIKISDGEPIVIDLRRDESISLHLQNHLVDNPYPNQSAPDSPAVLRLDGGRWTDKKYYILEWPPVPLQGTESISVAFVDAALPAAPRSKDELYVEPEKECSFCHRKRSEVNVLIEGDIFWNRICGDCVHDCLRIVAGHPGRGVKKMKPTSGGKGRGKKRMSRKGTRK